MEQSALGRMFMQIGNALLAQPAEMGAFPQLYAASMPDVRGGDYFGPDRMGGNRGYPKKVGSSRASRNVDTARALWMLSERLTGVSYLLS